MMETEAAPACAGDGQGADEIGIGDVTTIDEAGVRADGGGTVGDDPGIGDAHGAALGPTGIEAIGDWPTTGAVAAMAAMAVKVAARVAKRVRIGRDMS